MDQQQQQQQQHNYTQIIYWFKSRERSINQLIECNLYNYQGNPAQPADAISVRTFNLDTVVGRCAEKELLKLAPIT
ncbi:hypothetical protein FHG75_10650 [Xylella fastidiosa subsp. multiplex]|nr:hypothetical protein [Xylella fastidiosa subsp. multiplex]